MRTLLLSCCLTLLATAAAAQDPSIRERAGAYIDASATYGNYDLTTAGCTSPTCTASQRSHGLGWSLAIGATLNPDWRVGLQFDSHTTNFSDVNTENVNFYTAAVTWYPIETSTLWIRANVGYGGVRLVSGSEGTISAGVGIGYEWFPFQSEFAVMPWVSYLTQLTSGSLGGPNGTAEVKFLQFGLAVGLRH